MSDRLIRLQDAIEACWKARESAQMLDDSKSADKMMSGIYEVEKRLKKLSSVEIVHCKDCVHYKLRVHLAFCYPTKVCTILNFEDMDEDDFCSRAERKGGAEHE